jgi:predicted solute-binding protein
MKSKYTVNKCVRDKQFSKDPFMLSVSYYDCKGLPLLYGYTVAIPSNYGSTMRLDDLVKVRAACSLSFIEYRQKLGWPIEQLAAYYSKFTAVLRKDLSRYEK